MSAAAQNESETVRDVAVSATLLGETPFRFDAILRDWDQEQPSFLSTYQIVMQAPVKLETKDRLWMGQVVACRREEGRWRTTISVEQVLRHLPELLNLAERFE